MGIDINLTNHSHIFSDNELLDLKERNFLYGKNGTGKTTLCQEIKEQFGQEFDVRIFQGFESVIDEDEKLNAIVLGEENKVVQKMIDSKRKIIKNKEEQITQTVLLLNCLRGEDGVEKSPLLLQYENTKKNVTKKNNEIIEALQKCSREITYEFNLGRKYNRTNFKKDTLSSKKLAEEDYRRLCTIAETSGKAELTKLELPVINFEAYHKSVAEILKSKVNVIEIKELQKNPLKRKFAENGLELHNAGDTCTFCGGEVTSERITELKSVFDTLEVFQLQDRISKGIRTLDKCLDLLTTVSTLALADFYAHFDVEKINARLVSVKNDQINFFEACKKALEKKDLFTSIDSFDLKIPESFSGVQTEINDLIRLHNEFSINLEDNKNKAKVKLRLHRVAEKCEEIEYEKIESELETLKKISSDAYRLLDAEIKKTDLNKKLLESEIIVAREEIKQLQEEIKNPEIIITKINEKLVKSGKQNLELKYIEAGKHYKILNKDGSTRNIQEISQGEKNIIAFLYFIGSLDSSDLETGKPKIIILDDPMCSNDDTMQYLIISEIEKVYSRKDLFRHFILLTHNSHFYLKATYNRRNRRDGKNPYEIDRFIRLLNDGKHTSFKYLQNKNEDFATQYGSLWKELKFLYENDKKEFMCNTIRRIIETYVVFNGVSGNKDAESKMLFHTNSHLAEVGDLETDTNGYTREEIIGFMRTFFKKNNAEKHFNNYWNKA